MAFAFTKGYYRIHDTEGYIEDNLNDPRFYDSEEELIKAIRKFIDDEDNSRFDITDLNITIERVVESFTVTLTKNTYDVKIS